MPRYENRVQLALALLVGVLLLANLFTLAVVALTPATREVRAPVLFTIFLVTLIVSVPAVMLIPRWLLKPYRQLVDEAERAPLAARPRGGKGDEAEFVLETFQGVVAQLRAQQRELEKLSARASARAASAEAFSERIVASVPSGLVAFDAAGRTTVVNAPARALLEPAGDGAAARDLLRHAPELSEMVARCLESGEVYRREEVTATFGGGRVRRLGVTVAPIETGDGAPGGALCLLTDITEVVQLREAVALKRSLESLGEMSAGLAHEFKNALAALHGYAQLLQSLASDERSRACAADLLKEVRGLSEMVTSFLNFARPRPLQPEDVSLRELMEQCAADLRAVYDERGVALRLEGDFPDVRADERMHRQALLNLLRNAAEAFDAGAGDGECERPRLVFARGSRERDAEGREWVVVEVADTGEGIPEADLSRIFIPFFTTKSKGHGVGLALAHRVVTDHGGTLAAENAPAGGAVFRLRLPL